MPSWGELADAYDKRASESGGGDAQNWLVGELRKQLQTIGSLRDGRNVLLYASGFLQKPQAPQPSITITHEDVNGLMAVLYGMDFTKGLTLVLHTPGGVTTAAESFVEYVRSKFPDVEVIVPTFAFSAGTMIATGCDRIWMGRPSQLGPIDPQMPMPSTGRFVSATAIVAQFDKAKEDIVGAGNSSREVALTYGPILQAMGPALVQEARTSLLYSERTVARWMAQYMFKNSPDADDQAERVAAFLNDRDTHLDHSRRIGRSEAQAAGLRIEELEGHQELQEAALTAYHLVTILFERTPFAKIFFTDRGQAWVKSWAPAQPT